LADNVRYRTKIQIRAIRTSSSASVVGIVNFGNDPLGGMTLILWRVRTAAYVGPEGILIQATMGREALRIDYILRGECGEA
jgi:hypothetical protein